MMTSVNLCGFECENRSVRSATATGTCDIETGVPKEEFYKLYESLAKGHPGLMIMEHAFVEKRGHAGHSQLGIHTDEMVQYHKKAIEIMKAANPKIRTCCQLAHAGIAGGQPDKVDVNAATEEIFQEIILAFKNAAIRAKEAGYDCVQIHSAHRYLLSQSISNYINKREDDYKAEGFKLLKDVLAAVKTVKIPVGVKLQCDDFIEGYSMNPEQAAKILKAMDFDFIEISGGGSSPAKYITIRPGKDVYYYKHVVEVFRKEGILEKLPVICTGGFENVQMAEEAIKDGCAMVGFSRKFLRNDRFLLNDDKPCHRCNQCITGLVKSGCARCVFNK